MLYSLTPERQRQNLPVCFLFVFLFPECLLPAPLNTNFSFTFKAAAKLRRSKVRGRWSVDLPEGQSKGGIRIMIIINILHIIELDCLNFLK